MPALVAAGADHTLRDMGGLSPLDVAAANGRRAIVGALIKDGVDVTAADQNGWTALHYSAKNGHAEVSEAIMFAGEDPCVRTINQVSPLDVAVGHGHTRTVTRMIERGADVKDTDAMGFTSLHLTDQKDMVDLLVGAGADVNARNDEGNTPLMYQSVDVELVTTLMGHGALPNFQNEGGKTVLHMVMRDNRGQTMVAVVDLLLRAGADETLLDNDGNIPETCFEDETLAAKKARGLLRSAPMDRAWRRRRGLLLMCMAHHTVSPRHQVTTRNQKNIIHLATWLMDSRDITEGIFRTIVGYL